MIRLDESDRRILVRDSFIAEDQLVRRKLRPIATRIGIPLIRLVIKNNQVPAGVRVIKQLLVRRDQFRLRFIDAVIDDDRSVL